MINVRRRPGRLWYAVAKVYLIVFQIGFGLAAVSSPFSADHRTTVERVTLSMVFGLIALGSRRGARACENMEEKRRNEERPAT
jgi:hypothetical protein